MTPFSDDIERRASEYAARRGLEIDSRLGYGKDGSVFATRPTGPEPAAIKCFARKEPYAQELACYQRLAEHGVIEVLGHNVPRLLGHDEVLLVIEMSVVSDPFLLDFASARLDSAPEFPPEVMEEWIADKAEEFGADWPQVRTVLAHLRIALGIHLLDVHPGNITFRPRDE